MSTYTIISNTNKALLTSFVTTLLAGAPKAVTPLVKPISNPAAGGGGGGGSAGYAI
jgi:hypothetical protein